MVSVSLWVTVRGGGDGGGGIWALESNSQREDGGWGCSLRRVTEGGAGIVRKERCSRGTFELSGGLYSSGLESTRVFQTPRPSVDEIGYPKKSCGHYIVSKNVLMTLCSVKKCLIDAI